MRYYLDSEFIDSGVNGRGADIDLISIGIVSEDGRSYYAQSVEFNPDAASPWVWDNVIPALSMHQSSFGRHTHLKPYHKGLLGQSIRLHRYGQCTFENPAKDVVGPSGTKLPELLLCADCPWRTREQIRDEVVSFLDPEKYGKPELWGWCAGYDFVVFCQLFGTMMDLPDGYPHYIKDIQYILDEHSISDDQLPDEPPAGQAHNALVDARYIGQLWSHLNYMLTPRDWML